MIPVWRVVDGLLPASTRAVDVVADPIGFGNAGRQPARADGPEGRRRLRRADRISILQDGVGFHVHRVRTGRLGDLRRGFARRTARGPPRVDRRSLRWRWHLPFHLKRRYVVRFVVGGLCGRRVDVVVAGVGQ